MIACRCFFFWLLLFSLPLTSIHPFHRLAWARVVPPAVTKRTYIQQGRQHKSRRINMNYLLVGYYAGSASSLLRRCRCSSQQITTIQTAVSSEFTWLLGAEYTRIHTEWRRFALGLTPLCFQLGLGVFRWPVSRLIRHPSNTKVRSEEDWFPFSLSPAFSLIILNPVCRAGVGACDCSLLTQLWYLTASAEQSCFIPVIQRVHHTQ